MNGVSTRSHLLLAAGIALGVTAAGCYGSYAGTTTGDGTNTGDDPDASATADGGSDAGGLTNAPAGGTPTTNNDYGTPSKCTSATMWTSGAPATANMEPGKACNACHSKGDGPALFVAGTVYPSAHEPNDCNGSIGVKVVVTDAAGKVATLTANASGNFFCATRAKDACAGFTYPYNAYVVSGTSAVYRQMAGKQSTPDCNSCHTAAGSNGAPGRIMAP